VSALRQLLAALWAAVWLRGRLLRLRLRRLAGGGPAADAGFDFHLAAAEVPVEGVDYEPIVLPAELVARLEVARAELLDHARGGAVRQAPTLGVRRRRAVSLFVAAVVGLAGLGAGASALVRGTTGVPAVDRLLGIYEQGLDKPGASDRTGPSGSDLQPGPSKASEPIKTRLPDGSRSVTSFYVAKDGKICWAVAFSDGSGSGGTSCESPRDFVGGMRNGGYAPGIGFGSNYVVITGYVSGDVVSLSGSGPNGSLDIHLGKSWTPSSKPPVGRLKPFVAVASIDSRSNLDQPDQAREFQLRSYAFAAKMEDGRQIRIRP